ncbi:MAG: succinylglutamate desuccinylase/aspartoacylase family protein [Pseudomonadota bacterium]
MIVAKKASDFAHGKRLETWTIKGKGPHGLMVSRDLHVAHITGSAGPGPTLLFTGTIHGDEYEGPAALNHLIRTLDARTLAGRVIVLSVANPPALEARKRRSPFDDTDLNRAFPGDPNGTLSQAIAAWMVAELLPLADIVIDIHAAGDDAFLVPGPLGHPLTDPVQREKTLGLMRAFATPCALIADEAQAESMWDYQVEQSGKIFLTAEMGSAATLTPQSYAMTQRSIQNCLVQLDMLDAPAHAYQPWQDWSQPKLLIAQQDSFLTIPYSGFFVPHASAGQSVAKGDLLGTLQDVSQPTKEPEPLLSDRDGVIYAMPTGGVVDMRQYWLVIAREVPWAVQSYDGLETA